MKARGFSRQSTRRERLEGDTENIASKALERLHAGVPAAVYERVREVELTNISHFSKCIRLPEVNREAGEFAGGYLARPMWRVQTYNSW
jgi:hypothetical protein